MRFTRILVPAALFFSIVFASFIRFRWGVASLAFFDDDFFYYLKVAQHLAHQGSSTFDGIHLTNGYHPLWLLTLAVMSRVLPDHAMLFAVQIVLVLSIVVTYAGAYRCVKIYHAPEAVAQFVAVLAAFYQFNFARGGMEIILTVPLIIWFCAFLLKPGFVWSSLQSIGAGLLAAVIVLSRLDSILFVLAFFFLACMQTIFFSDNREGTAAITNTMPDVTTAKARSSGIAPILAAVVVCFVPIAIYLAINWMFFHTLTPVSGQAKQLRWHHGPSFSTVGTLVFGMPLAKRLITIFPPTIITLSALLLLVFNRNGIHQRHRPLIFAALLFPFLQLSALSVLSDWPVWSWYLYPFVIAFLAGSLVWIGAWMSMKTQASSQPSQLQSAALPSSVRSAFYAATTLLLLFTAGYEWRRTPYTNALYIVDKEAGDFAVTHPGRYAMGDSAATFAYLNPSPVIQLEGLVMDENYLAHIRHQERVTDVLAQYCVRYYVATVPRIDRACYDVVEPVQAGSDSPHMRDRICEKPIAKFVDNASGTAVAVFDLAGAIPNAAESQASAKP